MIKIQRTFPAPASLAVEAQKVSGKYDKPDVVNQLREDAHDKCYICEMKGLQDPEELIYFRLVNEDIDVCAIDVSNESAVLTASLVREVFSLKNTGMRVHKSEMRFQELNKEMNKLYDNLEDLKKNPNSKVVLRKLKAILRRESAFAAFKRNYIRDNKERFPQLLQYIA